MNSTAPGRSCPLHYHYAPSSFTRAPKQHLKDLEVLYVAGGLYGNTLALTSIESMFAGEKGKKQVIFNGDFHWFDANQHLFDQIESGVSKHHALRGNVETELVSDDHDAGCGCAYPDWVEDGVVARSNLILQSLRSYVTPTAKSRLSSLPMWEVASVGSKRIGIVHGDAESLAGWGFAQEHLNDHTHLNLLRSWFDAANVDVFASTHTCLPVMQSIQRSCGLAAWLVNNGSAGMPNFLGDPAGLITRIATHPQQGLPSRVSLEFDGLYIDLLAVEFNQTSWCDLFMNIWPFGSDANLSYLHRITNGPNYRPDQVLRQLSLEQITC